jgi:hypothetical protein
VRRPKKQPFSPGDRVLDVGSGHRGTVKRLSKGPPAQVLVLYDGGFSRYGAFATHGSRLEVLEER